MTATPRHIGVAGCGAMGRPMAEALRRAGFRISAYDVRPACEFDDFAAMLVPADTLSGCDALLCVVRTAGQVLDLCFRDQAVYRAPCYPPLLIVSSTLSPRFIVALAERLPDDVTLIDAPMSGAPHAAERASLSFMLGGDADAVNRCLPLFEAMGRKNAIFHVGGSAQGMAAKVFNNYVAAASVVAVRRALERASVWGLSHERLLEIMRASSGATWFGCEFANISWAREGYADGNTMAILCKDVAASLDAAGVAAGDDDAEPAAESDLFDRALLAALRAMPAYRCG